MEYMINHQLVKTLRQQKAWSQEQLADIAGISYRTVQRVERDGRASLETQKALASAFDIELEQLRIAESEEGTAPIVAGRAKGLAWGFAGIAVGGLCAFIAVFLDMRAGGISPFQAGTSLGLLGAICGLSCAALGAYSRRKA
ncbi:helix-turn-helix transcriptional regulator [Pseudoteredinibacter isoporae]|uniref:DNA-binding XRE family transcriptional regulator n=1 Tax=Pseudoteredinibacter isoporae TaxID=570281 RepID=A0A7X0MX35_9GAMM|nr:helix-turn-helix transcriptional regulator [Pseudoteredinibacter isoporae]MBB6522870.1 DNA-binding XRE family transcriptional regulator [Pseudoteredinibacter isoporae]NHO88396.1 helix-turn-helix transcriptional regulator [Pseudoteredinibacter isoporae]NIB23273.1 helix-turn-helix transcriptional regulator [Pseudoteredinibacter isoporae]